MFYIRTVLSGQKHSMLPFQTRSLAVPDAELGDGADRPELGRKPPGRFRARNTPKQTWATDKRVGS